MLTIDDVKSCNAMYVMSSSSLAEVLKLQIGVHV